MYRRVNITEKQTSLGVFRDQRTSRKNHVTAQPVVKQPTATPARMVREIQSDSLARKENVIGSSFLINKKLFSCIFKSNYVCTDIANCHLEHDYAETVYLRC